MCSLCRMTNLSFTIASACSAVIDTLRVGANCVPSGQSSAFISGSGIVRKINR